MKEMQVLRLDLLSDRHPGLTAALGQTFAEASAVCFARHHESPVVLLVWTNEQSGSLALSFEKPNMRTQHAYANQIDTTEAGAYGVSLAALESVAGLVAVRRAETLTGADWYLAPIGAVVDDLERCLRLEVSGTSEGTKGDIRRRLSQKVVQSSRGNSNLPAIATVVGFKLLEVAISKIEESRI